MRWKIVISSILYEKDPKTAKDEGHAQSVRRRGWAIFICITYNYVDMPRDSRDFLVGGHMQACAYPAD